MKSAPVGEPRRFLADVVAAAATDDCIIWPFYRFKGYAMVSENRQPVGAYRVAWELLHGRPFPQGLIARHMCGNGADGCVNPRHITPGTSQDNADDDVRLGRRHLRCGERHHQARLTWELVDSIRERAANGEPHRVIAADIGVSRRAVGRVASGEAWRPENDPRLISKQPGRPR